MTQEQLTDFVRSLLADQGVPIDTWRQNKANSLEKLVEEINSGECKLIIENNQIIRLVAVANINVKHTNVQGEVFLLVENKQVFRDGRERRRNLPVSLLEKLKPGESQTDAAKRALVEELGINTPVDIRKIGENQFFSQSLSYPGVMTRSDAWLFEVMLNNEQFSPEGYKEEQADKTTYFVWKKLQPST